MNPQPEPDQGLVPAADDWAQATDFDQLRPLLAEYLSDTDQAFVRSAFDLASYAHAGQQRQNGAPYVTHVIEVAKTLARLRLGREAIAAGLLHDVLEDTRVTAEDLKTRFGSDVAFLVGGVTKIGRVSFESAEQAQAENFRKMLLSMIQDVRILLIKLADRLHNMRTLEYMSPEKQRAIAQETLDIYAPLAHRMGIGRVKWQLEDLSFKYLHPDDYRHIEEHIGVKRVEREEYIERICAPIRDRLQEAGIQAEVTGRAKHFYSIYKKMQGRDKRLDELFDLLALRVVVQSVRDCYHALGILHTLYTPIHERFKDYIAMPKINGYRSLHTTLVGPDGQTLEIQVRTDEMHRMNEYGIAAHWKYKETRTDEQLDEQMQWLRQMLEEKKDLRDPREFMEALKIDLFQDEVFVFTPRGDLKQLPKGSTPIDFAYAVHSAIGERTTGARVNGHIVPLSYELANGDTVDIITSPSGHPSQAWLRLARTGRARIKIRHWIKAQRYTESVTLGREMLDRAVRQGRLKFDVDRQLTDVAQSIGYDEPEKLLAALGSGSQSLKVVLHKIQPPAPPKRRFGGFLQRDRAAAKAARPGIRVQGLSNMMVNCAHCCNPVPGDSIVGIVTRGRGVSVHRHDCVNIQGSREEPDRRIDVSWDADGQEAFVACVVVTGADRSNLLAELTKKISATGTNIQRGDWDARDGFAKVTFALQVRNLRQLNDVLLALRSVKNVRSVRREEGN